MASPCSDWLRNNQSPLDQIGPPFRTGYAPLSRDLQTHRVDALDRVVFLAWRTGSNLKFSHLDRAHWPRGMRYLLGVMNWIIPGGHAFRLSTDLGWAGETSSLSHNFMSHEICISPSSGCFRFAHVLWADNLQIHRCLGISFHRERSLLIIKS